MGRWQFYQLWRALQAKPLRSLLICRPSRHRTHHCPSQAQHPARTGLLKAPTFEVLRNGTRRLVSHLQEERQPASARTGVRAAYRHGPCQRSRPLGLLLTSQQFLCYALPALLLRSGLWNHQPADEGLTFPHLRTPHLVVAYSYHSLQSWYHSLPQMAKRCKCWVLQKAVRENAILSSTAPGNVRPQHQRISHQVLQWYLAPQFWR